MRKYRGLTKEGKWVYGWHFTFQGCSNGQEFTQHLIGDLENHDEVIPETVGQSTGLKDKNIKEIYEGDIILYPWAGGTHSKAYIEYKTYKYCSPKYTAMTIGDDENGDEIPWDSRAEVIGNIHQNPELMEQDNG